MLIPKPLIYMIGITIIYNNIHTYTLLNIHTNYYLKYLIIYIAYKNEYKFIE